MICVLFLKYQLLLQFTVFISFLTLRFYPCTNYLWFCFFTYFFPSLVMYVFGPYALFVVS
ncbi:hypothetical protein Hanom_Chr16g01520691 [Helianthus anomalus]